MPRDSKPMINLVFIFFTCRIHNKTYFNHSGGVCQVARAIADFALLLGFLPRENFIGPAVFLFWPLNRLGVINQKSGEQSAPAKDPSTNTVKSLK